MQHNRPTQRSLKKRPTLQDVVQSLVDAGRLDVAERIRELAGVEIKTSTPVVQEGRGKFRFAYLYVSTSKLDLEQQAKQLTDFVTACQKRNDESINKCLVQKETITVNLPKGLVVIAVRVPMKLYFDSTLPDIVASHKVIRAYLRKPRKDTQYRVQTNQ